MLSAVSQARGLSQEFAGWDRSKPGENIPGSDFVRACARELEEPQTRLPTATGLDPWLPKFILFFSLFLWREVVCWHIRDLLIRPYSGEHRTGLSGADARRHVDGAFKPQVTFFISISTGQAAQPPTIPTHRLIRQQKPTDSRLPSPLSVLTLSIKNFRASHDTRFCSSAFDTQVRGATVRGIMCAHT